jgi:hypothetical protein
MNEDELRAFLSTCLGHLMTTRTGEILYSGIDTLRKGEFYFLGFNPADDGTNPTLCKLPLGMTNWSAYTQQCWDHNCCGAFICQNQRGGANQHQKRVIRIMNELKLRPEETFATNLMFGESATAQELDVDNLLDPCWRVHQRFLAIVRPTFIVCLGNGEPANGTHSTFSLVRDQATESTPVTTQGHHKRFVGTFDLGAWGPELRVTVLGVRHPSWPMNPTGLREFAYPQ